MNNFEDLQEAAAKVAQHGLLPTVAKRLFML